MIGGVHGDEPEGQVAALNLARELQLEQAAGSVSELPGLGVEIDLDIVRAHPFEPELPQLVFDADGSVGDW